MRTSVSGDEATRNPIVLIAHGVPAYRCGLALGLRNSAPDAFEVRESTPADAAERTGWDACLVEVPCRDLAALAALRRARPDGVLIALLDAAGPDDYRAALRLGADSAAAQDADLDEIISVLRLALRGDVLLPRGVARALCTGPSRPPGAVQLTGVDRDLLTRLAMGNPVADIAKSTGYSERQMYRLVREIYHRLGSRNRSEAIATATRWGLITGEDADHPEPEPAPRPPPCGSRR
ncbi:MULTISPECIES: hypothetical protein [unclassified Saccharopolyspora]|uniref:helix-turn-helix transcriptional regulator n=1 Tax=unclassified Saccharopolyspora TaxID=2646250 RepID=UPI001CD7632B|nr:MULTISPECIES: hypothetical protein [unclassified Saccharopolyspora]MCA1188299.1 hypothetical protein [Saccharopolyspora sp. 6T]MCA1280514.1 hypothetical protein [Saccharopolyspora sp. 7B]